MGKWRVKMIQVYGGENWKIYGSPAGMAQWLRINHKPGIQFYSQSRHIPRLWVQELAYILNY